MKILVLLTDAFGGHGGIAKFNRDFLTALCSYEATSNVVAIPRLIVNPLETLPEKLSFVTSGTSGKVSFLLGVGRETVRNTDSDLIVCAHINLTPLACLLRATLRKPVLLIMHGVDAWQPNKSRLVNRLVGRFDAFAAVSGYTKSRFVEWSGLDAKPWFVLPNSVELSGFSPGPKSEDLVRRYGLQDKTVLMTLGRLDSLERAKGFDEVLEVLPSLRETRPDLVYMIAGAGPDRNRLEGKVKSLGLEEHVIFTGLVPEAEKADHYRLADAYVMPSRGEGFGIVILEALASGVPVMASKLDGSQEAVRGGKFGILVDPTDPDDVRRGILETLDRPRGVVPDGLDYFSSGSFEERVHAILDALRDRSPGSGG